MRACVEVDGGICGFQTRIQAESKGCCAACVAPMGAFKVMQVAAGVALPKDVTLRMRKET